ncbi:hypothetical protein [uncultured Bacteroides sp.]|nr:hypothetical protein [uncultured Bacteroides sp.]
MQSEWPARLPAGRKAQGQDRMPDCQPVCTGGCLPDHELMFNDK